MKDIALIREIMPGVLAGKEREGSGFEEKGKGEISHILRGGQSLWGSCEEWDPCAFPSQCEQKVVRPRRIMEGGLCAACRTGLQTLGFAKIPGTEAKQQNLLTRNKHPD